MPLDFACKIFELDDIIRCSLTLTKSDLLIMKFLIKEKKEMTSYFISNKLSLDLTTVQRALKKLHEKELILRSQKNLENGGYIYVYRVNEKDKIKRVIMETIHDWVKKVESELMRW